MATKLQGQDEIVIGRTPERVWPLVADSTLLPLWGPPVTGVELIAPNGRSEGLGSRRRVDALFNGRNGHFVEVRTEHVEGRRVAYTIEQDTFGLSRVMTEAGFALELQPEGDGHCRVIFSFVHNPKGLFGQLMNRLVILRQQRRNRLAALASLKHVAEEGQY